MEIIRQLINIAIDLQLSDQFSTVTVPIGRKRSATRSQLFTVAFLDFVTFGPLILRMRLGIKFLFVRLRFCYSFFSPAPHDIKLGSRFKVRRQLRPGGLSPQTDSMPVILKSGDM